MTNYLIVEDEVLRRDKIGEIIKGDEPEATLTFATNFLDAKQLIQSKKFDVIFLDHDLGKEHYIEAIKGNAVREGTGYELSKIIKDSVNSDSFVVVHSLNPVGTANILSVLTNAYQCPFYNLEKQFKSLKEIFSGN